MSTETSLEATQASAGHGLSWLSTEPDRDLMMWSEHPVVLELQDLESKDEERIEVGYAVVEAPDDDQLIGTARITDKRGNRYLVIDSWSREDERWIVERRLSLERLEAPVGVRLLLELRPRVPGVERFEQLRYFAPGSMYDLNDLNGDHVDDYVGSQTLLYREDRLSVMSVMAHHEAGTAFSLSRHGVPAYDPPLDREIGELTVLQRTDVGSLGVQPSPDGRTLLVAAYPFVERDHSHALNVSTRPGWGAYWPVSEGESLQVGYEVRIFSSATPQRALWDLLRARYRDLAPDPVRLERSLEDIVAYRLDALLDYHRVDDETGVAGFVTNCHPQDGRQLGNVIQYGFTGQNLLNSLGLLRGTDQARGRTAGLQVIDSYVGAAQRNEHGLVHGLYNIDEHRYDSWWTGLLLPLAYANVGKDLQELMGPLYDHLRPVIEALEGRHGAYLRCLVEEYDALLQAYKAEKSNSVSHDDWLEVCRTFAAFLVSVQEPDGGWRRAYSLEGDAITDPDFWFGQTELQQKSSTATVVPFLLGLHEITEDEALMSAALRAGDYVYETYVKGLKFNGGIHDSMYAKPQLIDHESIIFCFRALLELYRATGDERHLRRAEEAAWIVCTWVWLWDVPLPEGSTLREHGFRTTGWTGCDTPGAGYIHPMGIIAVPDLVEIGRATGEEAFLDIAHLVLQACNENVALPGSDWGLAKHGLQEEGVQVSHCWIDDPMFNETGFGGRSKGEGNKTCFPWISAVTVWAYQELLDRYGTADIDVLRS